MKNAIVTECCVGHPCDGCSTCRRGRCCRRDNPYYGLPKLGDWHGPMVGTLGVLEDDGDKAMCHICGEYFHSLGPHTSKLHDVTAREYKSMFGLKAKTPLCGPTLHATQVSHPPTWSIFGTDGFVSGSLTPEQKSERQKGRSMRLERRMEVARKPQRCSICGVLFTALIHQGRVTCSDECDAERRRRNGLRASQQEAMHKATRERVLEQKYRANNEGTRCPICEATFCSLSSSNKRVTCSRECDGERRRRVSASHPMTPEMVRKMKATHRGKRASEQCVICLAMFCSLNPTIRKVTCSKVCYHTHMGNIARSRQHGPEARKKISEARRKALMCAKMP